MKEKREEFDIIIDSKDSYRKYFRDFFRYRELFYFLAWRDVLVRYKQAFFGIAWALFRPTINMFLFAFLFRKIAQSPSDHVNYPLFVLSGLIPCQLFANAIVDTSNSVIHHAHLITKIYFPRLIVPFSAIAVHLLDFLVSLVLLFVLAIATGVLNFKTLVFLPFFFLQILLFCLGTGIWLSALTVRFRDVRFLVPFFAQCSLFISPVAYGSSFISESYRFFYYLNPLVGIIEGFRWAFFGVAHPELWWAVGISLISTVFLFCTGLAYFRKTEQIMADVI